MGDCMIGSISKLRGAPSVHIAVALACLAVSACGPMARSDAVPFEVQEQATVLGTPGLRYWADGDLSQFAGVAEESYQREKTAWEAAGNQGPLPPANFLAISGGGENGAFGAGLLVGWTKAGTRPQFKGVTGISTGALTAPFAFLGPEYDDTLKEVYTTITADKVLAQRGYLAALLDDAVADNKPLQETVTHYFDQALLDAIAVEHAKGRILLIGTTNLDARQPIIWNIGAIAESKHPGALELVRKILVASAAIPGAFPPMTFDVEQGGKTYQEMHVDGGASTQVFLYPPSLNVHERDRQLGVTRERHLYVLRNARLDPDWAQVERRTFSIAGRAITSLIQTQGMGDLYRIYLTSTRDGFDFNLAYIPSTFTTKLEAPFDSKYMNELFQLGYDMAVAGYLWEKAPPGFTLPQAESTATMPSGEAPPAAEPSS